MGDVQNFFTQWYPPNNASLVVCGDFDPAVAKDLIQKYFGEIPRGADASPITDAPAELAAEKLFEKQTIFLKAKFGSYGLHRRVMQARRRRLDILSFNDIRKGQHIVQKTCR